MTDSIKASTNLVSDQIINVAIAEWKTSLRSELDKMQTLRDDSERAALDLRRGLEKDFDGSVYNSENEITGIRSIFKGVRVVGNMYRITLSLIDTDVLVHEGGMHQMGKYRHIDLEEGSIIALDAYDATEASLARQQTAIRKELNNESEKRELLTTVIEAAQLVQDGHSDALNACREALK